MAVLAPLLLLCLTSLALSNAAQNVNNNYTLQLKQSKRYTLAVEQQYVFTVPIADASRENIGAVVFQVHAQRHQIVLSEHSVPQYGFYTNGSHIGLYRLVSSENKTMQFYVRVSCLTSCGTSSNETALVLVAAVVAYNNYPSPGGCTLTSPLNVDPNLDLSYDDLTTKVTFQPGNVGYTSPQDEPDCTAKRTDKPSLTNVNSLGYILYRQFLAWRSTNEEGMMSTIEKMLTANNLSSSGFAQVPVDSNSRQQVVFDSFVGEGVVYNALVVDQVNRYSTAYVPSVTYACDFNSAGELTCGSSLTSMIIGPIIGVIGVFLVFLAHRLFHVEVVVFTWFIATFTGYIVICTLYNSAPFAVRVGISVGIGVVVVIPLFMLWFFTGWYLLFVFFFVAAAGLLLGAIVMYTPFGLLSIWKMGYVYGLFMACVIVFLLIPAVVVPKIVNIMASSFVGSYMVVYCVGSFVYTSLNEIALRVVKNISIPGYLQSDSIYPFEINDIILVCVWFALFAGGMLIQGLLNRGRKPFPKSLYKQLKERMGMSDDFSERERLLANRYKSGDRKRGRRRLQSYVVSDGKGLNY